MITLEVALAEFAAAEKGHSQSAERLRVAAEALRSLAEERFQKTPQPQQAIPQRGFVPAKKYCETHDWPSLRLVRHWTLHPPPGLVESGSLIRVGKQVLIDGARLDEWCRGRSQLAVTPKRGRPRRQ